MILRRAVIALVVSALALTSLSACWNVDRRAGGEAADKLTDAEFYTLPSSIPAGQPGDIIRYKQADGAPAGSRAWRVIYHSRDMNGTDIPVSTLVIVPDNEAPLGGRVIVSWAHPTTGSAQKCGPSVGDDPYLGIEGLHELLAAGYAVTATDYQGMSVAGPSSYLLGVTEGNNVLDAVRAARNLSGLVLSNRVLLWGHSQGGQAALFAAQQARSYAPELNIQAVAVAAPAADLPSLLSHHLDDLSGVTISSYAFASFGAAYAADYPTGELQKILTPAGVTATPQMAQLCLITQGKEIHGIATPLIGAYTTSDPSTTEPWKTLLTQNSAGASPIAVPIFIGQGLADTLVIPTATAAYASSLCSAGEFVTFKEYKGISHALAAYASLPDVLGFFARVNSGQKPSAC